MGRREWFPSQQDCDVYVQVVLLLLVRRLNKLCRTIKSVKLSKIRNLNFSASVQSTEYSSPIAAAMSLI